MREYEHNVRTRKELFLFLVFAFCAGALIGISWAQETVEEREEDGSVL